MKLTKMGVELPDTRDRTGRARKKTALRPPSPWENRFKAAKRAARGAFLVLVYLTVAIAPLVLAWSGMEPGRGFMLDFSVALGFVGLSLMGLQFVVAARSRSRGPSAWTF